MSTNPNKKIEKFWIEDPCILITNFCSFNPLILFNNNKKLASKLNALTRLIIICMVVIFSINKKMMYVYIGIFLVVVIIILHFILRNDSFDSFETLPLPNNGPFLQNPNVNFNTKSKDLLKEQMLSRRDSDYYNTKTVNNNPLKNVEITDYGKKPDFSEATRSDSDMTKFVNGKIFQTADQFIFDRNTQPFYTTPNSSVPNDQTEFANWLYGVDENCKSGSIYMNRRGTPESSLNCNGFNVSTPTNFGNLNDYVPPEN